MMIPFLIMWGFWSILIVIALVRRQSWLDLFVLALAVTVLCYLAVPFGMAAVIGTMVGFHVLLFSYGLIARVVSRNASEADKDEDGREERGQDDGST